MENNLPKRKHPRLRQFDYSSPGAYFVTICTQDRRCILSRITEPGTNVNYTEYGEIAEQQLFLLSERYPFLTVDRYVIMPNHIHAVMVLGERKNESPRPTIMDIVCAYKSLTTRECKKLRASGKIFQTSFYDHVIRNEEEYEQIIKYISENPVRWSWDKLYVEE